MLQIEALNIITIN